MKTKVQVPVTEGRPVVVKPQFKNALQRKKKKDGTIPALISSTWKGDTFEDSSTRGGGAEEASAIDTFPGSNRLLPKSSGCVLRIPHAWHGRNACPLVDGIVHDKAVQIVANPTR